MVRMKIGCAYHQMLSTAPACKYLPPAFTAIYGDQISQHHHHVQPVGDIPRQLLQIRSLSHKYYQPHTFLTVHTRDAPSSSITRSAQICCSCSCRPAENVYLEKGMHIMVSTCFDKHQFVMSAYTHKQAKQQLLNTSGLSSWLVHSLAGLQ